MDYKETLHMPKTAFEMRGNLPKKEPVKENIIENPPKKKEKLGWHNF